MFIRQKIAYGIILTFFLSFTVINISSASSLGNLANDPEVGDFINNMVTKHGFDKDELVKLFNQVKIKQKILDAISRPAERSKAWHEYRKIFLTQKRIRHGVKFWQDNLEILNYAEKVYGVSSEIMVAIIGVETFYGRLQGSYRVMDALSTLGFKYPKRSKFFRSELKHFLLMSKEQKFDPLSKTGSYAGAMGMGQFIPSSFLSYAVDFNGDGKKNIWDDNADAIGSVANYFKKHGWKKGQPVADRVSLKTNNTLSKEDACRRSCKPKQNISSFKKRGLQGKTRKNDQSLAILLKLKQKNAFEYWLGYNNFYTISRYNHSTLYSMAVYQLSEEIKKAYQVQTNS
jgi:membrane-bound lytic murein transglycosylase B